MVLFIVLCLFLGPFNSQGYEKTPNTHTYMVVYTYTDMHPYLCTDSYFRNKEFAQECTIPIHSHLRVFFFLCGVTPKHINTSTHSITYLK